MHILAINDFVYLDLNIIKQTTCFLPINLYVLNRYLWSTVLYVNILTEKKQILMENKGKSGIYIWINKKNNNSYVGSGLNLGDNKKGRLTRYFWNSVLHRKDNKSIIHRAINKYGHSSFILGILEYCHPSCLTARENFYLEKLKPEYNILKLAYNSSGFKHSLDSLIKMRKPRPHFKLSRLHRDILSKTHKGKKVSLKTKEKISEAVSLPIYVYDSTCKTLLYSFPSITLAKKKLCISTRTIHKYMEKNMSYKGFLFFKSKIE